MARRTSPLVSAILIIASLYFARDLFVPIALAVLLSFLLAPLVHKLQHIGLHRVPAVLLVTVVAFGVSAGLAVLTTQQVITLATDLPSYEANLRSKIQGLRPSGGGVFNRAGKTLEGLQAELEHLTDGSAPAEPDEVPAPDASEEPVVTPAPVSVVEPPVGPWALLKSVATPVVRPLGITAIVTVLVIFFLIRWKDLRDRLLRLAGTKQLSLTTQALSEAGSRVSRYLFMQFIINGSYGMVVALGLVIIGVPSALLWGVLAAALRFIPYVGPWMAAGLPILTSIAVSEGWTIPFIVVGLFIVLELITNNILEPWLYGAGTGVSTVAILLGALFWTWLWGGTGLLLATPLTVCLVVMGRHVPQLEFLSIMLGDEPALDPPAQFYQRLLAFDVDGAGEMAEEFREGRTLAELYDLLLLPALAMAEQDRYAERLTAEQQTFVYDSMRDILAHLAAGDEALWANGEDGMSETSRAADRMVVLCVPVLSEGDELAGRMLAHLARSEGVDAHVVPAESTSAQKISAVSERRPDFTYLSALPPAITVQAANLCNQIGARAQAGGLVVALWGGGPQVSKLQRRLRSDPAPQLVTSLTEALELIRSTLAVDQAPMQEPPVPENESLRLASLEAFGLLDTESEETFDRYTKMLARIFDVPIALISLVDRERQWWKSHVGLPPDLAAARCTPRALSVCGHVVALNDVLVIPDLLRDKRFVNNPLIRRTGLRFYAGVPLRSECGLAIGSLCIIDTKPRRFDQKDRATLQAIAQSVMAEAEKRRKSHTPVTGTTADTADTLT